tara:strand:+ start:2165 stop:2611 length:447 start_codon:yes stop_codon:yes gene_type:complete
MRNKLKHMALQIFTKPPGQDMDGVSAILQDIHQSLTDRGYHTELKATSLDAKDKRITFKFSNGGAFPLACVSVKKSRDGTYRQASVQTLQDIEIGHYQSLRFSLCTEKGQTRLKDYIRSKASEYIRDAVADRNARRTSQLRLDQTFRR